MAIQLKQELTVSSVGSAVQMPSPQVLLQRPAMQSPLLHSLSNRQGAPPFIVPEAKQKPMRQKLLAQSASASQGNVPLGHAPQSAWQAS